MILQVDLNHYEFLHRCVTHGAFALTRPCFKHRCLVLAQASFFGFGAVPHIDIELFGLEDRKSKKVEMLEGPPQMMPVFGGKERVAGRVHVVVPGGKAMEHLGIKVELKGIIGLYHIVARLNARRMASFMFHTLWLQVRARCAFAPLVASDVLCAGTHGVAFAFESNVFCIV